LDALLADPKATARALDCADARESLRAYCGLIEIPGAPVGEEDDDAADALFDPVETDLAAHHELLVDKLEAIERGEIRRAMIFMPPGSAKSTYASVVFPSWFMGRKKRRNVGVATYGTDLARKVGRRVRSIIRQPVYREIFGTSLAADQGAANEWALDNGNEFMGAGILAGWTGNRLDGLVIDDPVKGREEADSPIIQEKTFAEYNDSLKTRLKPGGWVLLILTRWSENDLAGKLLPEDWDGESGPILCRDGLVWEVICIPAEAEKNDPLGRKPGEMLWQEWFGKDPDFWTSARKNRRTWSALYQQRPSPEGGTFFERETFRRYKPGEAPAHLRTYITSDHAPTDGEDSDPNVARVFGIDARKDVWYLDGFNAVQKMDATAARIVGNIEAAKGGRVEDGAALYEGLIRRWTPHAWFPEDDNNWKSAAPFIMQKMREEGVFTLVHPIKPHGQDKAARAQSAQGMAQEGRIWIPEGPEGDAILDQLVKFPTAAHDEEVDCLAIICRAIHMAHPAIIPPEDKPKGPPRGVSEMTWDELMQQQKPAVDRV
jgi:predicted phage terminase large subunit-like protein